MPVRLYFAGELFDHKHLTGNRMLAAAIADVSANRYLPVLPQETEFPEQRATAIRNHDFKLLFESHCAIFNFDGTDLDSGTVAEFVAAKMLDIPALILRSDFRHSGDQENGGDPWNLMCSGYPRTAVMTCNAMMLYQKHLCRGGSLESFYAELGREAVNKLDEAMAMPPLLTSPGERERICRWVLTALGSGMEQVFSPEAISTICAEPQNRLS